MEFLLSPAFFIGLPVVLVLLVLLVLGYLKAPPDTAYIISGLGKKTHSDR